ncbi:Creatinine amidohydrolase [subsurface metagenome]
MRLDELTWLEVKQYLEHNKSMIIPVGTCEQHSKHLPLNTDTLIAERIADFLSEETGIIIAPTVNYGVNLPCDRYYPGTSSLTEPILQKLLSSIIEWWKLQGFEKFYILSAHGDPVHLKALSKVDKADIRVLELYDLDIEDILEKQKKVKHAGEAETSVILFLYPEMVRKDEIEDFEISFEVFKDYLEHKKTEPIKGSPGCQGYPSVATKEKGRIIFYRMKKRALKWIKEN